MGARLLRCTRTKQDGPGCDTVKTLPRRNPGPTLRALSRRINGSRLFAGKAILWRFHQGRVGHPAGGQLAMTI
jgi:hypothetical protein